MNDTYRCPRCGAEATTLRQHGQYDRAKCGECGFVFKYRFRSDAMRRLMAGST